MFGSYETKFVMIKLQTRVFFCEVLFLFVIVCCMRVIQKVIYVLMLGGKGRGYHLN